MSDTGAISPSSMQDAAGVGTVTWSNVSNALTSNNSYADATLTGTSGTTIDSYDNSNYDGGFNLNSTTYIYRGQSFDNVNLMTLDSVTFYLYKTGSPTGNATVSIYAHTGTYGTSSLPTGSALATSGTLDVSTVTGSSTAYQFDFTGANKIRLSAGTKYCAVLNYSGGDGSNFITISIDSTSPTHGGNGVRSTNGSSWSVYSPAADNTFIVKGTTMLTSHYLRAYDFGFSLPTSTINGVKVEIEQSLESGAIGYESEVYIVKSGGVYGTTNKATGVSIPTTDTYVTYGGAADLWSEALTYADINDINFGVAFSVVGSNLKTQVDHIRITVYYTETPTSNFLLMFD